MGRSKRYKESVDKIDTSKAYTLEEAITFIKQNPVKFDAGVEIHINLTIDPKKSEQIVRSTVVLPHGTGKTKRVAAFVSADKEAEAKEAGADIIGNEDVIAEIKKTGKCDFDVAIATPDMMKKLGQIAKILGQQGLMPNPKTETVGPDVKKMVSELKGGKVAFRSDDGGNVHLLVGRVSYDAEKLIENINTFLEAVRKARPPEAKGVYMQKVILSSSMGPGISITVE
ncbi:50S ribosomal protein L1 [Patescibacteria group bacterium]